MKLYLIFLILNILKIIICQNGNESDYCDDPTQYGEDCSKNCPPNCIDKNCFRINGTCPSCQDNAFWKNDCSIPCSNCIDGCDISNGYCKGKCKNEAFYGPLCEEECNKTKPNCETCNKDDGVCNKCKDNNYWGDDCSTSCSNCIDGCDISNGYCKGNCKNEAFYGPLCKEECNKTKPNCETCNKDDGVCSKCKDDSYWDDDCSIPCSNCIDGCNITNGYCKGKCKNEAFYGPLCKEECNKTKPNCETCNKDDGVCNKCKDDIYWDDDCSTSCSNCIDGCNITNGICNNKEKCMGEEYYGELCEKRCNETRPNCEKCNKKDGICTVCTNDMFWDINCTTSCSNCIGGCNITDGTCLKDTCKDDEYYGELCEKRCNETRPNCEKCNKIDGVCSKCTNDMFWDKNCTTSCSNCIGGCNITDGICLEDTCRDDEFYGESCEKRCNETRPNCEKCNKLDGICTICTQNMFWGKNCTTSCSNCIGGCNITDGTCLEDTCRDDEYYGELCEKRCNETRPNCEKCNKKDGICTVCTNDMFWDINCTTSCSNCNGGCNITDGTCLEDTCRDDEYYGELCEKRCNETRPNCEKCNKLDGICTVCTNDMFWDINCTTSCSNCIGGCNISDGTCLNDTCRDDEYYGELCEKRCNETRPNCEKCNKIDGVCSKCTNDMFWDKNCTTSCSNCIGGCNITDGTCLEDTCRDDEYYGELCEKKCNETRPNCEKCNKIDGVCIKCTNDMFWDKNCTTSCFNCIGGCNITDGTCLKDTCRDDEYYGELCEKRCNETRPNCEKCNKIDGICTVCTNNMFWYKNCEKSCFNCIGGCNITDGFCTNTTNCKDDEYYGELCEKRCNETRPNCEKCNKKDGICIKCSNDNYWDNNCSTLSYCPNGCYVNGICFDQDENCKDTRFYGERCNTSCFNITKNCSTCNRNKTCISCLDNKSQGNKCSEPCGHCFGGTCQIDGTCLNQDKCENDFYYGVKCKEKCTFCSEEFGCFINKTCKNGCSWNFYSPPYCNLSCEENCNEGKCYDNGTCLGCTDEHFYGNFCNETVRDNLTNCETAVQDGSYCKKCENDTHYGDLCENECSIGCKNTHNETGDKICEKDGGYCVGCESEYFGSRCDEICHGCQGGCDDQGYCNEFKCVEGKYGLKCDENCTCELNSKDMECGKFAGECSNCNYGYFGKKCNNQCHYKCKTALCCIFKDEKSKPKTKIKTNYNSIIVTYNNTNYTVEIDYNYGYPLSLFISGNCPTIKKTGINLGEFGENKIVHNIDFTNYAIKAHLFKNQSFIIYGNNKKEELKNIDIQIAEDVNCSNPSNTLNGAYGVIGLGFFNTISNYFFSNESIEHNILSYSVNYKKDTVELIFGAISDKQYDYIEKLTSCDVAFKNDTEIQGKTMTCKLEGIKSSQHSSGLQLNNAFITFSIGQNSSFVLKNDPNYRKFIEKVYFIDKPTKEIDNKTGNIYFLYPKKKINKLHNFGFVFNDFYYSYEPNLFFSKKTYDGKKRFLIEFSDKAENSEFILGREFLKDITFTINNEEAEIYFYAKNAEYCDKLKENPSSRNFRTHLETREVAAILLAIIVFINIVAFVIYYFIKKKKMNSDDYIKID